MRSSQNINSEFQEAKKNKSNTYLQKYIMYAQSTLIIISLEVCLTTLSLKAILYEANFNLFSYK